MENFYFHSLFSRTVAQLSLCIVSDCVHQDNDDVLVSELASKSLLGRKGLISVTCKIPMTSEVFFRDSLKAKRYQNNDQLE